jgi:hypothetical protein
MSKKATAVRRLTNLWLSNRLERGDYDVALRDVLSRENIEAVERLDLLRDYASDYALDAHRTRQLVKMWLRERRLGERSQ